jgi:pheromone shutdown-related protein TraB
MKYNDIVVVGTSHIAEQSVNEVSRVIGNEKPDIVAVELDRGRLKGLLSGKKSRVRVSDIRKIGVKAYFFTLIASYVQQKLGRIVGVAPGSDMLQAVKLAKQKKLQLALIDQDISITLRKFSKVFTWKEKFRFFVDVLKGIFFGKRQVRKMGLNELDLTKVPSKKVIKKLIKQVEVRYPSLYRVLIKERNVVMARNLVALKKAYPEKKIVAIVGAGHEDEIVRLIGKICVSKVEFVK